MITFYSSKEVPYGPFSNFSPHPVEVYGRVWKTSEHAFQAQKYNPHRPDLVDLVANADGPMYAANLGRDRTFPIRKDWDDQPSIGLFASINQYQPDDKIERQGNYERLFSRMKDLVMYEVVLAKFDKNPELKKLLLSTEDEVIIEDSKVDAYWGWGKFGNGQNKLGRILMLVRKVIRD